MSIGEPVARRVRARDRRPACISGRDGQSDMCGQEEEKCTNLIEEADAGQNLLDALLELTVGGAEGDVGSVGDAAASQQGDDAATLLGDDRARVASIRESATRTVVGDDRELARRELHIEGLVMTNEGLRAAHPTRSRS